MLDEVPLDLYFIDWLEIWSSGKRLGLYFIDWLAIRSSQSPFSSRLANRISLFRISSIFDFLECWCFGPDRKIKEQDMQCSSSETAAPVFLNMGPLRSSFTAYVKPKAAFVASHEVDPCEVKRNPNPALYFLHGCQSIF